MINQRDIIDNFIDTFVKRLENVDINVYTEMTFVSIPEIAKRLNCSVSTVKRMVERGLLLVYYKYRGRRRYVATNETLLRLSFRAWCQAYQNERQSPTSPPESLTRS